MLLLYRIIFIIILILGSPYLLIKALWGKHGIKERLGFIPERSTTGRLFWFHAASVGELKVLSSVIPEVKMLAPDIELAISTTTATGKRRAEELFKGRAIILLQPLELKSAIIRALNRLNAEKLVLVETEIWPLLMAMAVEHGIETSLVNARMSPRSFILYRWFKPLLRRILGRMRYVLVQSNADARRFESLGVRDPIVVGNTKFDQAVTLNRGENPQIDLPRANRLVLVAGCIRRGEDEIFANIIARCEREGCPIFFVLVPRHMKDLSELENRLRREKISYDLWSRVRGREINRFSTLVVDSMGELTNFYRIADLTFVGGSLVPIGGHDPAEPAALGRPVIFGPHMENASMAARLLLESGGATMIHDGGELFEILRDSVGNRASLADRGERCRAVILSMAGVSKKIARILMGESF